MSRRQSGGAHDACGMRAWEALDVFLCVQRPADMPIAGGRFLLWQSPPKTRRRQGEGGDVMRYMRHEPYSNLLRPPNNALPAGRVAYASMVVWV